MDDTTAQGGIIAIATTEVAIILVVVIDAAIGLGDTKTNAYAEHTVAAAITDIGNSPHKQVSGYTA